jgi:hypothetical protein
MKKSNDSMMTAESYCEIQWSLSSPVHSGDRQARFLPLDSVTDSVNDPVNDLVDYLYFPRVYIEALVPYRIDRVLILIVRFNSSILLVKGTAC